MYFRYAALLEDENKGGQNLFLNHLKIKLKMKIRHKNKFFVKNHHLF